MCSGVAPKQFPSGGPLGAGAGVTTQPATAYASSANPSLTDASAAPGTAPTTPAKPAIPGSNTNLGQGSAASSNPFLLALQQLGMG